MHLSCLDDFIAMPLFRNPFYPSKSASRSVGHSVELLCAPNFILAVSETIEGENKKKK